MGSAPGRLRTLSQSGAKTAVKMQPVWIQIIDWHTLGHKPPIFNPYVNAYECLCQGFEFGLNYIPPKNNPTRLHWISLPIQRKIYALVGGFIIFGSITPDVYAGRPDRPTHPSPPVDHRLFWVGQVGQVKKKRWGKPFWVANREELVVFWPPSISSPTCKQPLATIYVVHL